MQKLKLLVALATSLFVGLATAGPALEKLDVASYSKEGGNGWKWANMFKEVLVTEGYQSDLISAGSCFNLKKYMANNNKPTVFFHSDISINAAEALGCEMVPSENNFEGVLFSRVNTMCVRKEDAKATAMDHFKGRDEITIAIHADLEPVLMETLGKELGVKFKQVQYSGSSKVMKGLLAGDTEMLYTGLTKREATNKGLHCFTTTSDANVGDQVPLRSLVPNYEFAGLKSYWYVFMHGLDASQRKEVWADLVDMTETNQQLNGFITTSSMIPHKQLPKLSREDVLANRQKWK